MLRGYLKKINKTKRLLYKDNQKRQIAAENQKYKH
jgi:hypothetical protein